jgi:hypothetical protein
MGPRKAVSTETAAEVHKRVTGMFDGRHVRARAFLVKSLKLLLAAGVAAALALMLLPPSGLPPATKSETLPPQISLDLEGLTQYHRPPQLHYSNGEVNAYLAYVLGKKKEMLDHLLFDFERAVVVFHPGRCKVTVGRSIFGYSIYTSGVFTAEVQGGKLNAAAERGAIGRLPIHPKLMPYANFLFGDAVRALERERKLIAHAGSLEMRDKEIIFAAL